MSKLLQQLNGPTQSIMLIILTWWIAFWVTILLVISWRHTVDFSMHVLKTEGAIIELHPERHNTFIYQFEVASRVYKGSGYGANMVTTTNLTRAVYYDSHNPSENMLEDPVIEANNILTAIGRVIAFGLVSSACLLLKIAVQKWLYSRQSDTLEITFK